MNIREEVQEVKNRAEGLYEHLTEYIEARYNLTVLEVSNKVSDLSASIAASVVVGVLGVFVLLFASLGVALWIGQASGNLASGFFYVALFYALLAGIIFSLRSRLIKIPVANALIRKFFYNGSEAKN